MRPRAEIEKDVDCREWDSLNAQALRIPPLILEVLLDIRDQLKEHEVPIEEKVKQMIRDGRFQPVNLEPK